MAERERLPGEEFTPKPESGDFSIRKVYVKDISFETPHSPAIFGVEWTPETDVNLRSNVQLLEAGEYEITLAVTATVKVGEQTAFLVEVQQAGIFNIVGLTSDELAPILSAYCPAMLYPYAREVVSDLVVRGGFPPFVLAPINFDALYHHRLAEQQSNDGEVSPTDG